MPLRDTEDQKKWEHMLTNYIYARTCGEGEGSTYVTALFDELEEERGIIEKLSDDEISACINFGF